MRATELPFNYCCAYEMSSNPLWFPYNIYEVLVCYTSKDLSLQTKQRSFLHPPPPPNKPSRRYCSAHLSVSQLAKLRRQVPRENRFPTALKHRSRKQKKSLKREPTKAQISRQKRNGEAGALDKRELSCRQLYSTIPKKYLHRRLPQSTKALWVRKPALSANPVNRTQY